MKAPEEMAIEYSDLREFADRRLDYKAKMLLEQGFLAGYKAAKDQLADVCKVMPQWISVKERLPEDKHSVIYWHDQFGANVGHYDSTYPKPNYHWWSYSFGDNADFRVKWWMPLPEPPKEEK